MVPALMLCCVDWGASWFSSGALEGGSHGGSTLLDEFETPEWFAGFSPPAGQVGRSTSTALGPGGVNVFNRTALSHPTLWVGGEQVGSPYPDGSGRMQVRSERPCLSLRFLPHT